MQESQWPSATRLLIQSLKQRTSTQHATQLHMCNGAAFFKNSELKERKRFALETYNTRKLSCTDSKPWTPMQNCECVWCAAMHMHQNYAWLNTEVSEKHAFQGLTQALRIQKWLEPKWAAEIALPISQTRFAQQLKDISQFEGTHICKVEAQLQPLWRLNKYDRLFLQKTPFCIRCLPGDWIHCADDYL